MLWGAIRNTLKNIKMKGNVLEVCILEARDLITGDSKGRNDAFTRVTFARQKFSTRVQSCKRQPRWDQRVLFDVPARGSLDIHFSVFDEDALRDDLLGTVLVDATTVRELRGSIGVPKNMWLKLTDAFGTEGDFGTLHVVIRWQYVSKRRGLKRLSILGSLGMNKKVKGEEMGILAEDDEATELLLHESEDESDDNMAIVPVEPESETEKEADPLEQVEQIDIKPGTWRVIFRVVEVRELKGEDLQGTSDPVCTVSCISPARKPVKRSTKIIKGVRSAVFDEELFLDLTDMDEETVEATSILFAVYDADLISRNDLIGSYTFNLLDVYYHKNHAQRNIWLGLVDELNPKDSGIQGYGKVSVCVLGPGDKAVIDDSEIEGDTGEILLPPNIQLDLRFLRVAIYQGADLPLMDSANLVRSVGGIDAYVLANFDSSNCKTKTISVQGHKNDLHVVFNEEMWLPTWNPCLSRNISFSLYDRDATSKDDLVGTLIVNYQDVRRKTSKHPMEGRIGPRWYNFYGCQVSSRGGSSTNQEAKKMNRNPSYGSAYRGRLLLKFIDQPDDDDEEEIAHKKYVRPIKQTQLPTECTYVMNLAVFGGSELPKMKKFLGIKSNSSFRVSFSCGTRKLSSSYVTPVKGCGSWNSFHSMEIQLPRELQDTWDRLDVQAVLKQYDKLKAEIESAENELPDFWKRSQARGSMKHSPLHIKLEAQLKSVEKWLLKELDNCQVPDLFLYLEDKTDSIVAFARFDPYELLVRDRFAPNVQWIPLKEDKANNYLDDDDFPGNLQVCLGFCAKENPLALEWNPDIVEVSTQKKNVHIFIHQGSELPGADKDALSDPYVVVKCLGRKEKLKKQKKTVNPNWSQVVSFDDLEFGPEPQVVVDVYDHDKFDSDDYLGSARISLELSNTSACWYPVYKVTPGDCGGACILVSFSASEVSPVVVDPVPDRPANLQVLVLGLRDMISYQGTNISNPMVQFDMGDNSKSKNVFKTANRNKPSGSNPNFCQLIDIPISVPEDLAFVQRLNIKVVDSRYGGLSKPIVGVGSIDLLPFLVRELIDKRRSISEAHNPNIIEGSSRCSETDWDIGSEYSNDETEQATFLEEEEVDCFIEIPDANVASLVPFVNWLNHDPYPLPEFMHGRDSLVHDLETEIGTSCFTKFPIMRGKYPKQQICGYLKAIIRVVHPDDTLNDHYRDEMFTDEVLNRLMVPAAVQIRVNVLKGFNFIPMDVGGGKSDPYLVLKLGKTKITDQKNYINNSTNPEFYRRFDIQTTLPGPGLLTINAMDYDSFSFDDFIGGTMIDLEDRWLNEIWQSCGDREEQVRELNSDENDVEAGGIELTDKIYRKKPVEVRSLWAATSQLEQGKLECWIDIMDHATAVKYPAVDIAPPENSEYELRVIVWKSAEIPSMELFTEQNDLFVKCNFNGASDKLWLETDTHWRCKEGKGSWNWRMKFPFTKLPLSKLKSRLAIQIWDRDLTKWNDCIAETILDLDSHLKSAFMSNAESYQVFSDHDEEAVRLPVSTLPTKSQPDRSYSEISIVVDGESAGKSKTKDTNENKKENKAEARELIDTYVPTWAGDMFNGDRPPPNSKALNLFMHENGDRKEMGVLYVSVELVRKDIASTTLSNGSGRSEPNRFPKLPKPVGRLKWSLMWNPFYLLRECLGPKLCRRFCCCFIITLILAITIIAFPQVSGLMTFINSLPGGSGYILLALLAVGIIAACAYCAIAERVERKKSESKIEMVQVGESVQV